MFQFWRLIVQANSPMLNSCPFPSPHTHTHTHTHMHACIHTLTPTYIQQLTQIHTCANTHTHTHTHTHVADPGSAMLDHFNHLRRQWAAKAQFLQANLKSITTVDVGRVLGREEIRVAIYCHHISAAYIHIPQGPTVASFPAHRDGCLGIGLYRTHYTIDYFQQKAGVKVLLSLLPKAHIHCVDKVRYMSDTSNCR